MSDLKLQYNELVDKLQGLMGHISESDLAERSELLERAENLMAELEDMEVK